MKTAFVLYVYGLNNLSYNGDMELYSILTAIHICYSENISGLTDRTEQVPRIYLK